MVFRYAILFFFALLRTFSLHLSTDYNLVLIAIGIEIWSLYAGIRYDNGHLFNTLNFAEKTGRMIELGDGRIIRD